MNYRKHPPGDERMNLATLDRHSTNGRSNGLHLHDETPDQAPMTVLEEKQSILAHMVRMVVRKVSHGLFVAGTGGTGKSYTISKVLAEEGVCPILCNSHITALSLYQTLYEYRTGHILWLDDVDGIFSSLPVLGILRSALWGQGERVVTYSSTSSHLNEYPRRFVFDSQIIMCANTFPRRNEAFKAVLSRIDVFHLHLTNEEVVEHMRRLSASGFGSLSPEQCLEIVEFIAQAGGTRQLSMRLYEPSLRKVEYARERGIDWRDLVRCQLDQIGENNNQKPDAKAFLIAALEQAMQAFPKSVQRQQEAWCKATGKSRASFFRLKSEDRGR